MSEAELKVAVDEYLQYQQNQGKLVFLRLNAGDFIEVRGNTRRRIRGCPKGTADFEVIREFAPEIIACRVIFLELKGEKGRWPPEQRAFKVMVEEQGAEYYIIKSIEELEQALE